MSAALRKPMTHEEFFAWAERQDRKHWFDGSQPVAMVNATNAHGIIARNLNGQLYVRLRGKQCQSMPDSGGGVATINGRIRYPEASVSCATIRGRERLMADPVVVFEVLSDSTRTFDQVHKLREYHAVPTIKRHILIEQEEIAITVHARTGVEPWSTTVHGDGEVLALPEIGIELPIADLYESVAFEDVTPAP